MPEKLPRRTKLDGLVLEAQGLKQKEVAIVLGISERVLQKAKHNLRYHGDIEGGQQKRGRKPLLNAEMEDVRPSFSAMEGLTARDWFTWPCECLQPICPSMQTP
jgi:transposase